MLANADEGQLFFVSIGVVGLSIAAFAVFLTHANTAIFYVIALIALILGFYLSYNLSRQGRQAPQPQKKQRGRKAR